MFKVGDIVRITGGADYHHLKIGSKGIVLYRESELAWAVDGLHESGTYVLDQIVLAEDLEVVE